MSDLDLTDLLDVDNVHGFLDDIAGMAKQAFNSIFKSDGFAGQNVFPAVVISDPVGILGFEYEALGLGPAGTGADESYRKFKVRIATKGPNPHAILRDPCDLSTAADLCQQNALVAAHTTIVTKKTLGLNIGSFIRVRLFKNKDKTYNLQVGEYVDSIDAPNETGKSILTTAACDSIRTYFKYAENWEPPPAITVASDIRQAAENYDNTPDIPGKQRALIPGYGSHAQYLDRPFKEGSGKVFAIHDNFKPFVKALIWFAYQEGITVQITSGYRSNSQQAALALDPNQSMPVAEAGTSLHQAGMAVDLNFYQNGEAYTSTSQSKDRWEASDLVKIAETIVGMKWGGRFKSYDPVHFEFNTDQWGDNATQYAEQIAAGRAVDTVNEGITTGEARADETEYTNRSGRYSESTTEESPPGEILEAADRYASGETSEVDVYEEEILESTRHPDE